MSTVNTSGGVVLLGSYGVSAGSSGAAAAPVITIRYYEVFNATGSYREIEVTPVTLGSYDALKITAPNGRAVTFAAVEGQPVIIDLGRLYASGYPDPFIYRVQGFESGASGVPIGGSQAFEVEEQPPIEDPLENTTAPVISMQNGAGLEEGQVVIVQAGVYNDGTKTPETLTYTVFTNDTESTSGGDELVGADLPYTVTAAEDLLYIYINEHATYPGDTATDTVSNVLGPFAAIAPTGPYPIDPRPEAGEWTVQQQSASDTTKFVGVFTPAVSLGVAGAQWTNTPVGAPVGQYQDTGSASDPGWADLTDNADGTWSIGEASAKIKASEDYGQLGFRYKTHADDTKWSLAAPNRIHLFWVEPQTETEWYNLGLRTPQEYTAYGIGQPVQEGFQWFRSWDQAGEQVYFGHDVAGVWESGNDAFLIRPVRGLGNYTKGAQSICLDPTHPEAFWVVGLGEGNAAATAIYFSNDKGETNSITYSIPSAWNANGRNTGLFWANKNLNVDPTTLTGATSLRRVYAVIQKMNSASSAAADGAQVLTREPSAGNTWTLRATLTQATHGNIYGIYPHPTKAGYAYMCTSTGLFKSTDYGANFTKITTAGIPSGDIREIWIKPTSSSSGTADTVIFGVEDKGIYKTTNSFSSTVTTLKSDTAVVRCTVSNVDNNYIFAIPSDSSGPIYSHNGGSSWSRGAQTGRPGSSSQQWIGGVSGPYQRMAFIQPHYSNKNLAWAHASNILFRTTDGGATWVVWAHGFTGNRMGDGMGQPIGFDVSNPQRFSVGLGDVTCVTTNGMTGYTQRKGSDTWTDPYTPSCMCMGLEPSAGSNILVATIGRVAGNGVIVRSTNYGVNWTLVDSTKCWSLFWDKADTNFIYAASRRSKDKGVTWAGAGHFICGLSADGLTVWGVDNATSTTDIYKATNGHTSGSLTWALSKSFAYRMYGGGSAVMELQYFPPFAAHPTNTNRYYTINSSGEIIRVDGTTITTPSNGPLAQAGGRQPVSGLNLRNGVVNIQIDPQNPQIVYAFLKAIGIPWCYMSIDDGATWTDITRNIPLYGATASGGQTIHPLTGEVITGWHVGTRVKRPPAGFTYTHTPISVSGQLEILG